MKQFIFFVTVLCFTILNAHAQEQYFPISDAMLRGGSYAEDNYGSVEEMYLKAHPSNDDYSRKIIMQFDISSTSYSSIKSAVLKIYCTYLHENFPATVFPTDNNWEENTVTWSNAPTPGEEITTVTLTDDLVGNYVEFDISSFAISQFNENKIISLILNDKSIANAHARFYSRETAEYKPVLELEYGVQVIPASPVELKVTNVSATNVGLEWSDQSSEEDGFRIYRKKSGGVYVEAGTTPADSNVFVDYGLEANTTYFYRVVSFNNFGESDSPEEVSATTTDYSGNDYYVDNQEGNDNNDGLTPQTAWKTLTKLNQFIFEPGDKILFKSDQIWEGELHPQGSGIEGMPVIIDKHGTGELPHLKGPGTELSNTFFLYNQEYWEINNIKLTNPEPGNSAEFYKRAVYVLAKDTGQINHIHFKNIEITDVEVPMEDFANSRFYGGIYFEVLGNEKTTWFNDMLFESCYFHHLDRTGLSNQSTWWKRGANSSFGDQINDPGTTTTYDNWVPSENIVVRNCRFEHIGGNGLIMRVSKNTLVENNYFTHCAEDISGNAAFCFNTDSTIFQRNEACFTIYNDGDTDARGIDSDFRTKHTIIQYNYLHNNGKGGVVATGGNGGQTTVPRFNIGTIIRYNVIANNEQHIVRTSGNLYDLSVYNNVFYSDESINDLVVIENGKWGGAAVEGAYYYNNIFYVKGNNPTYDLENGNNNLFSNNAYFGSSGIVRQDDINRIISDPLLASPGVASDIDHLEGFKLSEGSPCIGSGKLIEGAPENDFFGVALSTPVDVGIYQFSNDVTVSNDNMVLANDVAVRFFPNPTKSLMNVILEDNYTGKLKGSVYDLGGKLIADFEKSSPGKGIVVNLTHLGIQKGLYILEIKTETNKMFSAKIVVH